MLIRHIHRLSCCCSFVRPVIILHFLHFMSFHHATTFWSCSLMCHHLTRFLTNYSHKKRLKKKKKMSGYYQYISKWLFLKIVESVSLTSLNCVVTSSSYPVMVMTSWPGSIFSGTLPGYRPWRLVPWKYGSSSFLSISCIVGFTSDCRVTGPKFCHEKKFYC